MKEIKITCDLCGELIEIGCAAKLVAYSQTASLSDASFERDYHPHCLIEMQSKILAVEMS